MRTEILSLSTLDGRKAYTELRLMMLVRSEMIFLAKRNGVIIAAFTNNTKGTFHFHLLPADITRLDILSSFELRH